MEFNLFKYNNNTKTFSFFLYEKRKPLRPPFLRINNLHTTVYIYLLSKFIHLIIRKHSPIICPILTQMILMVSS